MHEPMKKADGWYVETDDGLSGPWAVKAAATAIAEGSMTKANMINNRAIQRDKVYHKGAKK